VGVERVCRVASAALREAEVATISKSVSALDTSALVSVFSFSLVGVVSVGFWCISLCFSSSLSSISGLSEATFSSFVVIDADLDLVDPLEP
jgi:hypothetical protein